MGHNFFITALPRSRTAWVANYLSAGGAFCYHDGLANCATLDEFDTKLSRHPICGDSDSGLAMFHVELRNRYPTAKWVVLHRDPREVVRSLIRMKPYAGFPPVTQSAAWETVEHLSEALAGLSGQPGVLDIDANDLSTSQGARALWQHCLADIPWSGERYAMLRDMNVTIRSEDIYISLLAATSLLGRAA